MALFDAIGGEAAVAAVVEDYIRRLQADPATAAYFHDADSSAIIVHLRAFLAVGLGGPEEYTGRGMREAHAPLAITAEVFDVAIGHLTGALTDRGLAPEVVTRVVTIVARLQPAIVVG